MKSKWNILLIAASGLILREILSPFTGHPFDFELWVRIGYYVSRGNDPYVRTFPVSGLSFPGAGLMSWIGYPPTWAFFQAGIYKFYAALGVDNRFLDYLIVKQPMIIGDMVSAYMLYRIIGSYSGTTKGIRAFTFWMFCPLTIVISSIWGMFDQIILVLVLASIFLISETKKSALIQAFAFLLKVIPLIYLPIFAFVQETKRKVILYLCVSIVTSVFFALAPYLFFKSWKLSELIGVGVDVTHKLGNSMNYWETLYVYNYYFPHSLPVFASSIIGGLSYVWAPALLLGSYYCATSVRKSSDLRKGLYLSLLYITLIFFVTKSVVNEQYSIYFLGLGLVDYYVYSRPERMRLFNAIWLVVLGFLFVNNTYLIRFLSPISIYYTSLDHLLTLGFVGEIRSIILIAISILFTTLCVLYLKRLHAEIRSMRISNRSSANNN